MDFGNGRRRAPRREGRHPYKNSRGQPGPYKKLAVGSRTRTKHLGYDDKMIAEVNEAIDYADDEEG